MCSESGQGDTPSMKNITRIRGTASCGLTSVNVFTSVNVHAHTRVHTHTHTDTHGQRLCYARARARAHRHAHTHTKPCAHICIHIDR